MMEVIHSSETSVLTRTTRRSFPGDGILLNRSNVRLPSLVTTHVNVEWLCLDTPGTVSEFIIKDVEIDGSFVT
jgi:hypothetical protein